MEPLYLLVSGMLGICILSVVTALAYKQRAKMAEIRYTRQEENVQYLKEMNERLEEKTDQLEYLYKDQVQFAAMLSEQIYGRKSIKSWENEWEKVMTEHYRDRIKLKACYEYSPRELIKYRMDLKDIHNRIVLDTLQNIAEEILKQKAFVQNEFQTAIMSPDHDRRRGIIEVEVLRPKQKE